jgi:GNAT superfamily N-acetyltransferase
VSAESTKAADLRVTELTIDHLDAWSGLFVACASDCFCRYWHFEGTKNDWLAQLALRPETNERTQRERVIAHHAEAGGMLAFDGEVAVGWLKLVPRETVPKLRRLPVYRGLDLGDDEGVLSIGCLLTHPSYRRKGVARALVLGAIRAATKRGATALEAYPHVRSEALRDEELWMGPASLFEECGFSSVGGNTAYPVFRRTIRLPMTLE